MGIVVRITDGKRTYLEDVTEDYQGEKESYTRALPEFELKTDILEQFNVMTNYAHFVFGWCESFFQSDDVPGWMYESEECLKIEVQN